MPRPTTRSWRYPHAIIDAGFDAYVREHWTTLLGGKTLHVAFLVPSRREWMDFSVRRIDASKTAAQGAAVFRLRLGSWFGFMLPHVDVRYTASMISVCSTTVAPATSAMRVTTIPGSTSCSRLIKSSLR